MASCYAEVLFKSDGEPAIKELKREAVKKVREDVAMNVQFEESAVASSGSNGTVEGHLGS